MSKNIKLLQYEHFWALRLEVLKMAFLKKKKLLMKFPPCPSHEKSYSPGFQGIQGFMYKLVHLFCNINSEENVQRVETFMVSEAGVALRITGFCVSFWVEGTLMEGCKRAYCRIKYGLQLGGLLKGTSSGIWKARPFPNPLHPMITLHVKLKFEKGIMSNKSDISLFSGPQKSPDLKPLDFSLWGHVMSNVYQCQPGWPEEPGEWLL